MVLQWKKNYLQEKTSNIVFFKSLEKLLFIE